MEQPNFNGIIDFYKRFPDEISCIEYLIQTRWNGKPVCPHCGSSRKVYKIRKGKVLTCADCRKQFTVKVGTIFEDSALPLQKWFMAIYILTAHKKGISSLQLSKDIHVTQKTAWFMLHRIRFAVKTKSFDKPLSGTVEVDESYFGGKSENKHQNKRKKGTQGRNTETKTPVFGMVQRDGEIRAMPVINVKRITLHKIIKENIKLGSNLMTDDFRAYNGLSKHYNHKRIGHLKKEYVRENIHTQNIENFWSLMKRGIIGIYHTVSEKHIHRYTDEFAYRYNSRKVNDSQRFASALSRIDCRLTYKKLIED